MIDRRRVAIASLLVAAVIGGLTSTPTAAAATLAPAPVRHARVTSVSSSVVYLAWTNPKSKRFNSVVVRVIRGHAVPPSPTRGAKVSTVGKRSHTVTAKHLAAGTEYTFALFASDGHKHYARRVVVHAITGPGAVGHLASSVTDASAALSWHNPTTKSFDSVVVRYAKGSTAPSAAWHGTGVHLSSAKATSAGVAKLAAGTKYTFAIWARDRTHRYSTRATRTVTTYNYPGPVSAVHATPQTPTSVALSWSRPSLAALAGVRIRRSAPGGAAPATPGAGTPVAWASKSVTTFLDSTLPTFGLYRYTLFSYDATGHYAKGVSVSATTTEHTAPPSTIQGTVRATDSQAALAGVVVTAGDDTDDPTPIASTTTASDGSYSLTGLSPGDTYVLCFDPSKVAGAPPTGYARSCRDDRITPSASTVSFGLDVLLAPAASVTGQVTGNGVNLTGVKVLVYPTTAAGDEPPLAQTTTDADGRYSITGLTPSPAAGYAVCFDATGVIGTFSHTGVESRCDHNIPWSAGRDVPPDVTPIQLTSGHTLAINQALPASGALSGHVTAGGVAVSGVRVSVRDSIDGVRAGSVTTGDDGRYRVTGLPATTDGYDVCFDASQASGAPATGYAGQCYRDVVWDGVTVPDGIQTVAVYAGQTTPSIDAHLTGGAGISGSVTNATGATKLAGVVVQVYSDDLDLLASATTDAAGAYRVNGLAPTTFGDVVCFDASALTSGRGYVDQCYSNRSWTAGTRPPGAAARVVPATGSPKPNINAALATAGAISGTVTSFTGGHPLGGVRVSAINVFGEIELGHTTTAANGTYTVPRLPSGSVALCFATTAATTYRPATGLLDKCFHDVQWSGSVSNLPTGITKVAVTPGVTTTGKDAALRSAGIISGTVTGYTGGDRLANVTVQLFRAVGDPVGPPTLTAADGTYQLRGIGTGTYGVCFDATAARGGAVLTGYRDQCYSGGVWTGSGVPSRLSPVKVTSGAITAGINVPLYAAAAITGTVTAGGADVSASVYDQDGTEVGSAPTAAAGHYEVDQLEPTAGPFTVCFAPTADPSDYVPQCYGSATWSGDDYDLPSGATPVATTGGHRTYGINATLTPTGSLRGSVTSAAGGAHLDAVDVDVFDGDGDVVAYTTTDGTGGYEVTGLAPATYVVCFDTSSRPADDDTGYLSECYHDVAWDGGYEAPPDADSVVVHSASETAGIDAALTPAAAISGQVSGASDGSPLASVRVEVIDADGNRIGFDYTGADGRYRVSGLVPSSDGYFVCFAASDAQGPAPDGYDSQCYDGVTWDGDELDVPPDTVVVSADAGDDTRNIDARLPDYA